MEQRGANTNKIKQNKFKIEDLESLLNLAKAR